MRQHGEGVSTDRVRPKVTGKCEVRADGWEKVTGAQSGPFHPALNRWYMPSEFLQVAFGAVHGLVRPVVQLCGTCAIA